MSTPFVRASAAYRPPRSPVFGLFDGITLAPDQVRSAHDVFADAIDAQLGVTLRNSEGWAKIAEIHTNRDRALRALLANEDERSLFDHHCADLRLRQIELRPANPTAPVVLRAGVAALLGGTLEVVFRADGMSEEAMETASWQIVHAFRSDAELLGVSRVTAIADILERRDQFATYMRSVKRTFGRQADGAWVPLPAP